MMRRLPIFFVLDCSESMVGPNIKKLNDGLQMIINDLKKDPHALETAWVSVIAFAGIAKTIVPLIEVFSFYPPRLPIGGGTSLGAALKELTVQLDKQVRKTTLEQKGDWKPVVYLLTDGHPTDNIAAEIAHWKKNYAHKVNLIAIGLGASADLNTLQQLTDNVLLFTETQEGDFTKFIKWISASVSAHSRSVSDDTPTLLNKTDSIVSLTKTDIPKSYDENCVILVGRCSKSTQPYLIKYERLNLNLKGSLQELNLDIPSFNLAGCFPIDEDYFTWSDVSASSTLAVNTSELYGAPGCPHCGNTSAFAVCSCGKLLCINGPDDLICPWCKQGVAFGENGGESDFDVNRSKG